jgi:hypothetical protein
MTAVIHSNRGGNETTIPEKAAMNGTTGPPLTTNFDKVSNPCHTSLNSSRKEVTFISAL